MGKADMDYEGPREMNAGREDKQPVVIDQVPQDADRQASKKSAAASKPKSSKPEQAIILECSPKAHPAEKGNSSQSTMELSQNSQKPQIDMSKDSEVQAIPSFI